MTAGRLGKNTERKRKRCPAAPLRAKHQTGMGAEVFGEAGFQAQHAGQRTKKGTPGHWKAPGQCGEEEARGEEQAHKVGQEMSSGSTLKLHMRGSDPHIPSPETRARSQTATGGTPRTDPEGTAGAPKTGVTLHHSPER